MAVSKADSLKIASEIDIVQVRQEVRRWCTELKFSLVDLTKMVTAASELARNTLVYGKGGTLTLQVVENDIKRGLTLIFEDKGPGIPDITKAMQDGFTTGGGLGMGLPGTRRLVNEFEIDSSPGHGTKVTITRWK